MIETKRITFQARPQVCNVHLRVHVCVCVCACVHVCVHVCVCVCVYMCVYMCVCVCECVCVVCVVCVWMCVGGGGFTAKTMEWSSLHLGVTITPKPFTPGEWLTMEWSSLHFGVTITPQSFTPREWLHYGVTIIPFGGVTWFEVVKLMIGKWLKHAVNNYIQQMLLTVADWTLKGDSIKCERWSNILYSIWKFTFQLQSNSMLWAELCGERCYQLWWYSDTTSSSSWPSLQQSDTGVVLYMKLTTTVMLAGI